MAAIEKAKEYLITKGVYAAHAADAAYAAADAARTELRDKILQHGILLISQEEE
jgi:hypothetical protein